MHVKARPEDMGEFAIVAGDPDRLPMIVERFDGGMEASHHVTSSRGYGVYTGTIDGTRVSAVAHGIGCPSAAIVLEELAQLGVKTVIRVGTCGGLQPYVRPGDVIVSTACVRDEGTSRQYLPLEVPATAHMGVVLSAVEAAADAGLTLGAHEKGDASQTPHALAGMTHCKDSFYSELEGSTAVEEINAGRWASWKAAGVLATEMEASALYVVGGLRGMRTGVVLAVVGSTGDESADFFASPEVMSAARDRAIEVTVGAMRRLIRTERAS